MHQVVVPSGQTWVESVDLEGSDLVAPEAVFAAADTAGRVPASPLI